MKNQFNPIAAVAKQFVLDLEKKYVFLDGFAGRESFLNPLAPLEENLARYPAISAWRAARLITFVKSPFVGQIDKEPGGCLPPTLARGLTCTSPSTFKDALNLFFKLRNQLPSNNESPERTLIQ